MIIVIPVTKI